MSDLNNKISVQLLCYLKDTGRVALWRKPKALSWNFMFYYTGSVLYQYPWESYIFTEAQYVGHDS
ncbi:MAG: hypothetical protein CL868_15810 [Cytophagaceae bacterium]|nr:hypothetical protein [Cytophagaceae bacterium]